MIPNSNAALFGRLVALLVLPAAAMAQQPGAIAIDQQEWRDAPMRHLYIHGVLNGDTAFHVYLPAETSWQGRVFQYLQGGLGGSENEGVRMGHHVYALSNGGAYVESSQGHMGPAFWEQNDTPSELAYEAS
jgi:predicted Abi (CAAX) family protease